MNVLQWLANLQPALVGAVLLWAGGIKLLSRSARLAARRSALVRLVGKDRVFVAYRAVGAVEVGIGALLVAPPVHPAEGLAAAGLGAAMLGYLGYARLAAPGSSCGCLGDKHVPVRFRGFARAAVLMLAGALAVAATEFWTVTLTESPLATVGVLLAEAALIVVLSPELDHRWLHPLRRLRLRISHPLAGRPAEVPLAASVQQLHKSAAYSSVAGLLRSDLLDTWDEGDWRLLAYAARTESGKVTAVFAVPRLGFRPEEVRVVLVPEAELPAPV
ncbi:MAG TPA: MauE/DoxX family redox-associated membrane protein [Actinophytocola sp.]|uniref:MauE/DoxX family redox-associated membrane protein n=1 Tax=Actinophytocola sp. TaxID=1872138 RepID=UPI002DB8CE45|nr:MauE/DoxX family redox-associated membrane protein [Actinophytocola sp.]HEU5475040.1 MauE/DoxX family redox-associated membrane protein [Actinophytocola sp.]